MVFINVGNKVVRAEHLVLDFNGTLAVEGRLIPDVEKMLIALSDLLKIHIVTANTYNNVQENTSKIGCNVVIVDSNNQQSAKAKYVNCLGHEKVIAIGNGLNDALMLKAAAIGIAVIEKEGASVKAIEHADLVCTSIMDALELVQNPIRIFSSIRT